MMKNNGDIVSFLKQKDYIMINNDLGGGSFGKTVLLQDPFIDELFVAKMYSPEFDEIKEKYYKNFLDEIKIMYKLSHPNIVRIYNYYAYEKAYTGYIIMEYIDGENIEDFMTNYVPWQDMTLDNVFIQLIDGFCYIENHGIVHRDIREGNILIDKTGTVKIIDFGIGKLLEPGLPQTQEDSLADEINRQNSDTLPQEYYEGTYTSQTDMFYLAELFNRLMTRIDPVLIEFSYWEVLEKMMNKNPTHRYQSFADVKATINKNNFMNMEISERDKEIYRDFTDAIYSSIANYINKPEFVNEPSVFIQKLEGVLKNNLFEEVIQNKNDIIKSIVLGSYKHYVNRDIPCEVVRNFLNWFKKSTNEMQKIILSNIISKLSVIDIEYDFMDLPFD